MDDYDALTYELTNMKSVTPQIFDPRHYLTNINFL